MTGPSEKIEVVVNDYSALNRGVHDAAQRTTLATRLLSARVLQERAKSVFWIALIIGFLFVLIGIAFFIARGNLDLSWGGSKETIRYIKVPDPNLSRVIEKTVIVEKPVLTPVPIDEKNTGVETSFTIFKRVKNVDVTGIDVVTRHHYPNSSTRVPEAQSCYASADQEGDGVRETTELALKKRGNDPEILKINEQKAEKLGISIEGANKLHTHCKIRDFKESEPPVSSDSASSEDKIIPEISASSGSGFAINDKGYFLTNEHVVKSCTTQGIIYGGTPRKLEIIAKDSALDLAILKSSSIKIIDYLRFAPTLVTGQEIYAFGYPFLGELSKEIKVTDGIVSSLAGLKNNLSRIQITAPLQPGNSGGPVVGDKGLVVGVAVSGMVGAEYQNVNFAVKKDDVLRYLSKNRIPFEVAEQGVSQQIPNIVKKMKDAVFPIFCLRKT